MTGELSVEGLVAGYGPTVVLHDVSLGVIPGEIVAVLGRNGVGKSTLLKTLIGISTLHKGRISFAGQAIEDLPPYRRARLGIGYVSQEREIFPSLTVEENLAVSALPGGWTIEQVYDLFPRLKERRSNTGNRLSGGEQQMLAVGRALLGAPKVLLLDEPLEGLAPVIVDALLDALHRIRQQAGITMIVVEQRAALALSISERAIVLDRGRIVHAAGSKEMAADVATQERLLGARGGSSDDAVPAAIVRNDLSRQVT
jgi:branched-chain amino acid transport system ATP-binding protein